MVPYFGKELKNMRREHVIRSSLTELNMASWCVERSRAVTEIFADLVDMFTNKQALTPQIRGRVEDLLAAGLWDATKLLSFACGAEWRAEDGELIAKDGRRGREVLEEAYGLSSKELGIAQRRSELEECRALLQGPRSPNRTVLHEFFEVSGRCSDSFFGIVENALEEVSQGNLSWEDFREKALLEAEAYSSALDEELSKLRDLQRGRF